MNINILLYNIPKYCSDKTNTKIKLMDKLFRHKINTYYINHHCYNKKQYKYLIKKFCKRKNKSKNKIVKSIDTRINLNKSYFFYNCRQKFLNFFKNIHTLKINNCDFIHDEHILKLKKLKHLNCNHCMNISDLSLSRSSLKSLYCVGCINITDKSLFYLNLNSLAFSFNNITDKGLEQQTNLKKLAIMLNSTITDECIKKLKKLRIFICYETNISYGLKKLKKLKSLITNYNYRISNLHIVNLNNLIKLDCFNCPKITDNSVKFLKNLKILNIGQINCEFNIYISDISISNLVNLKKLRCVNCNYITDKSISKLKNLTLLSCELTNQITDKSIIKLNKLKSLFCSHCKYITNDSIKNLKNLISLSINNNNISNYGIKNLVNLKYLYFRSNIITSDVFKNLVNLKILNCYNSKNIVADDFYNLKNLKNINCGLCSNINPIMFHNLNSINTIKKIDYISNLKIELFFKNLNYLICKKINYDSDIYTLDYNDYEFIETFCKHYDSTVFFIEELYNNFGYSIVI